MSNKTNHWLMESIALSAGEMRKDAAALREIAAAIQLLIHSGNIPGDGTSKIECEARRIYNRLIWHQERQKALQSEFGA